MIYQEDTFIVYDSKSGEYYGKTGNSNMGRDKEYLLTNNNKPVTNSMGDYTEKVTLEKTDDGYIIYFKSVL